jgi:hypothetical protein
MPRRLILGLSAVILALGITTVAAPKAFAVGAPVEICNNASNLIVCMNRNGGGTVNGTRVIGWHPNDPNNDFEWLHENSRCGGAVTATCPFLDPSLNQLYFGDAIVRAHDYNHDKCLVSGGRDQQGFIRGVLSGCNDFGHSFILPGCLAVNFGTCADNHFRGVPNVDETNISNGTHGPALCLAWGVTAIGTDLYMDDDCIADAQDAFQQSFFP